MNEQILIGYKIGDAAPVYVEETHLVVTGLTQKSGKTTTLEGLIGRSGLRAIAFRTKKGEQSFSAGTFTAPFFRDRSDYEFVKSLIEAYSKEKLFIEKGTLMELCKGSSSLLEIKKKVDSNLLGDETLKRKPATGIKREILIRLQHYLENLIPQIQYANLSSTLNLVDSINIMDLTNFTEEAQSLVIQSVADEVLNNWTKTILILPEAWKFIPQKYNNPCKRIVESFVRQGASNRNFIWIDSQDMAGVDKIPLKSVATWILGLQSERNEVKHTLDQMPIPKRNKPSEDEIMRLKKGQFFVCSPEQHTLAYVQPAWLDSESAKNVALGTLDVNDIHKPLSAVLPAISEIRNEEPKARAIRDMEDMRNEFSQLRRSVLEKIAEITEYVGKLSQMMQTAPPAELKESKIDAEKITLMVRSELPNFELMKNEMVKEILAKVPMNGRGPATYTVEPLKALQKKMQQEAKESIIASINELSPERKKIIQFIESAQKGVKQSDIATKCLGLGSNEGGNHKKTRGEILELESKGLIRFDIKHSTVSPMLHDKIKDYMQVHGGTDEEVNEVYNHVIDYLLN